VQWRQCDSTVRQRDNDSTIMRKCDIAMTKVRYWDGDNAIVISNYRIIAITLSHCRHRVIALSSSHYHIVDISLSHSRIIVLESSRYCAIALSHCRHRSVVLSSSHYRTVALSHAGLYSIITMALTVFRIKLPVYVLVQYPKQSHLFAILLFSRSMGGILDFE
jgi:hypothetical protein